MNEKKNIYGKSYILHPTHLNSPKINYLKQFSIFCSLEPNLAIFYSDQPGQNHLIPILKINSHPKIIVSKWFGDYLEIEYSLENQDQTFHFNIGLINNFILGYCSQPIEKMKTLKLNNGYISFKHHSNESHFFGSFRYKSHPEEIIQNREKFGTIVSFIESDNPKNALKEIFQKSITQKRNNPSIPMILSKSITISASFEKLWNDIFLLYEVNKYQPEDHFKDFWICPCRYSGFQFDKIAMWDTLHCIEDNIYLNFNDAVRMMKHHFTMIEPETGMWAQDKSCSSQYDGKDVYQNSKGLNFKISQPPIWSESYLHIAETLQNPAFIPDAFNKMKKNITWWEKNRYFPDYCLFGYPNKPIHIMSNESGLDNSARYYFQFNGKKWKKRKRDFQRSLITVDLNSQMVNYYRNMYILALQIKEEDASIYLKKADELETAINLHLWDDIQGFYFDFDVKSKVLQPIFTQSSLWVLFGMKIPKKHLSRIITHIRDPQKFWTQLPLPTIARDSPFFSKDMWNGPVWISQNYWILLGLLKNRQENLVRELWMKMMDYLGASYEKYGKIFEFYNPISLDNSKLLRKRNKKGPKPQYNCHFPIYALMNQIAAAAAKNITEKTLLKK